MRLWRAHQLAFPKLHRWMLHEFKSEALSNPGVFPALNEVAGLNEDSVRAAMTWGTLPVARVHPSLGSPGAFLPVRPNYILLDFPVVRRFERLYPNSCAKRFMEALVLHELAHWGHFRVRGNPEPGEVGEAFEQRAYGYVVTEDPICSPRAEERAEMRDLEDL